MPGSFTFPSDANATLPASYGANALLQIRGSVLSATRTLTPNYTPLTGAILVLDNGEGQSVTFGGITVASGKHAFLYYDGTNWNRLTGDA
jgi:hypothetical protein